MTPTPQSDPRPARGLARLFGERSEGRLVRGSLLTFGIQGSAAALGLGLHVALTWLLQSETQYGLYLMAMSTITIAAVPIVAGWDTVLMRFLAQYDARPGNAGPGDAPPAQEPSSDPGHAAKRNSDVNASLDVSALAARNATLYSLAWFALSLLVGWWLLQSERVPVGWSRTIQACVIVSVPFLAWSMLRQGALRGRHRGAISTIPESILRPVITVSGVALAALLGTQLNAEVVMLSAVVAGAIAMLAGSLMLPEWLRVVLVPRFNARDAAASPSNTAIWRHLASASLMSGLAIVLIQRVDEWLLGWLVSPAESGVYGPASRFAGLVVFGLNAVNPILAPMLAASQHDRAECQRLAKRGARLSLLISTPLTLALVFFPRLFLGALPEAYSVGAIVLQILAVAQWVNAFCGSVGNILSMTGHHRDLARILLFSASMNIALNLLLIPAFGALGAAIATGTSIITWNILAWLAVKMRLGIDASAI
ncbi:MAG: polysaccharide biosynthesis C-terminal domain-containing protein [Planctomycetales bacterium]|nr:polysaccharide biosynthesis C-terminal domain-containing protein [Planctomycetales bacterium]